MIGPLFIHDFGPEDIAASVEAVSSTDGKSCTRQGARKLLALVLFQPDAISALQYRDTPAILRSLVSLAG